MFSYSKRINQFFITKYMNRNWRIMILKFIDITQIYSKYQSLPIEGLWCFSMFSVNTFWMIATGFNDRVIVHLKHSSSSFLRLIIAFFAARNARSRIQEKSPSGSYFTVWSSRLKTEWNLNYFLVFEILLKTPKQLFSFSKTIR